MELDFNSYIIMGTSLIILIFQVVIIWIVTKPKKKTEHTLDDIYAVLPIINENQQVLYREIKELKKNPPMAVISGNGHEPEEVASGATAFKFVPEPPQDIPMEEKPVERTDEQKQSDKDKMAKARAARGKK